MSIIIELPPEEIAELKRATKQQDAAEAIIIAVREYLRLQKLRELMSVSGKVEFELDWQELDERELAEAGFPK